VQVADRIAVVTGGSSGIGAAIARRLTREDWKCVLLARGEERLRAVAEEIGAEYEVCDVGDRAAVERAAADVLERHPRIGLLVNNAGIPGRRGFLRPDPEMIEQLVQINYLGSVWSLLAFLPGLEAAAPSAVVNIVSVAGLVAFPASGPYSAAKHAQLAFSRAVTAELRPRGIRVHTVSPGFVETEGFPQRGFLQMPLIGRLVVGPDRVADHVLRVLRRNRRETHVPGWYRIAPLSQALLPGVLHRILSRAGYRRART
jgi:NAD(P)-dependent dehydrogenase (short-subunit alcohol dehydrogenase family)